MSAECVDREFPSHGLLPKKETGIESFILKYPEYDGRGVIIAIFDSGVDPRAPGLQVTTTGKTKVIERFDCSGAGDVDTSMVVSPEPGANAYIEGLTGRLLKIPPTWINPTGRYHLGVKNAFELYPSYVQEHMEKIRRTKLWDPNYKMALCDASRKLYEFDKAYPTPAGSEKLIKEDLEAQVEMIVAMDKKYVDVGPAYDCVVFHDGSMWRACIDTSETGNLIDSPTVGEYSKTHECRSLTDDDQLSFSINIHDNGNTLEIVTMCSSHGTHVASIAAGNFPDEPQKNGCAPGAQIVSLTIGDNRLGSMETGTALVRAIMRVMSDVGPKIDIINMSYGEHAHFSGSGRIGELMNEAVDKYGAVWVAAAGNHGPALCTIGTPPDISSSNIIGVGAYVSPDMMAAEYALWQKLPSMLYTWTSRGPTIDGDMGVTICAPGAAITSVPTFTLRNRQLMNGTSMASPHVAGGVALVLSAMKKKNLPYSPYSLKRALEASALHLDSLDKFAQGQGLLQIEKAFDHISSYHSQPERDVRFKISCGPQASKGVHLRGGLNQADRELAISVEPVFLHEEEIDCNIKIQFGLRLALTSDETWVLHPTHLDLTNIARVFNIKINTSALPVGAHHTSIKAYDVACVEKGPVFRIPVTVIIPTHLTEEVNSHRELVFRDIAFKPNTIKRHFVFVPQGATWAVLKIRCVNKDNRWGRFVIHSVQLRPRLVCKTLESYKSLIVTPHQDIAHGFCVRGNLVLELVVAKYWASLGDMTLKYKLTFFGVKPDRPTIVMQASDGILPIEVTSALATEDIMPVISLKTTVQVLRPTEAKVTPLGPRDIIPKCRQIYELQLSYSFTLSKATEVTPNCPMLSDMLYESEFESQLWMLFDTNKQLMSTGDAYPTKYTKKLEKGEYTIRLHVRHERKELLEKLTDQVMLINEKLPSAINLDVYSSQPQATTQGKKMAPMCLSPGQIMPIYIGLLASETRTSKGLNFGQYLLGSAVFAKDEMGRKVDSYEFKYIFPDVPKKVTKDPAAKDKTKLDEYLESIRDTKISWLSKLDFGTPQSDALYQELSKDYPDHLPVQLAMMQGADPWEAKRQLPFFTHPEQGDTRFLQPEHYETILSVASVVLMNVDCNAVLAHAGIKVDLRADCQKHKVVMERQKGALLEAIARKGVLLCRKYRLEQCNLQSRGDAPSKEEQLLPMIDNLWKDIVKLAEPTDPKVLYFAMWHASILKQYGRLFKLLVKANEEKNTKEVDLKMAEVAVLIGWNHISGQIKRSIPVRYPLSYRPF